MGSNGMGSKVQIEDRIVHSQTCALLLLLLPATAPCSPPPEADCMYTLAIYSTQ